MGLQDWLAAHPVEKGGVDLGAREREHEPSRTVVRLGAIAGLSVLTGWFYFVWTICQGRLAEVLAWALGTGAYLFFAYLVHPTPDHDDLGWFGGLIDNPFRFSDDMNRVLVLLALLLWPGRFVTESLAALARPPAPPGPPVERAPRPPWPGTFVWPAPATGAPLAASSFTWPPPQPPPSSAPQQQPSPWPSLLQPPSSAPQQQPQPSPWPAPPPPPSSPSGWPVPAGQPVPQPPPAWTAEVVVSPELAAELIAAQFPELAPVQVAPLGVGWDNTAFRVNGAYVFRFPRREVAVPLLETETRLLPAIAARLPLPVPVPAFLGRPTPAFRWPFAGYPFLEGRTACRARLDPQQRLEAAEPLGRFLAALHAVPVDEMVALGVGGDSIGRLDLTTRVPRALEILNRLPPDALGADPDAVGRLIESSAAIRAPAAHVLAHGDLYVRHLLVDEQARLCGIIDWGDLHAGNPAVDLAVAYGFLPPAARPAFLKAYARRVPAPTWWLARFRAVFGALCILDYARQTGDTDLEREGRESLANAVAGA